MSTTTPAKSSEWATHEPHKQLRSPAVRPEITSTTRFRIGTSSSLSSTTTSPSSVKWGAAGSGSFLTEDDPQNKQDDTWNYALLIILYTLQGIPMGLSASIPFLIQQKIQQLMSLSTSSSASLSEGASSLAGAAMTAVSSSSTQQSAAALSYNANAIFALCSWPFSLKLLWAPIVDACFIPRFGRRKSWLVPVQSLAGILMVLGSQFVERQLGLQSQPQQHLNHHHSNHLLAAGVESFHVRGVTLFFLLLYFLMATQDIAVDGYALTLLSPKNRGRGPVCNSIGQNIGYFISFVGFLALNDVESSERWWRPLLGLPSDPGQGLVSLGSFLRFMGYVMLITTAAVAVFKTEARVPPHNNNVSSGTTMRLKRKVEEDLDDGAELDASEIGLRETYHRLWAVCQLPAVRWLFLVLLTYRLPTALGDNVKFLKAVEFGLSKSTTALLSPTIILPLGILVPIVATKIWQGFPLRQFMTAYKLRVTIVPLLDMLMLYLLKQQQQQHRHAAPSSSWWLLCLPVIVLSTAAQAIVQSMQFNSQMTFFAHRVDPAIGGSYMTLLNTAANLGGTWPSSVVLWLMSRLSNNPGNHHPNDMSSSSYSTTSSSRDPYFVVQAAFTILGLVWIWIFSGRVQHLAQLPDDAWRTHLLPNDNNDTNNDDPWESSQGFGGEPHSRGGRNPQQSYLSSVDVELGGSFNASDSLVRQHRTLQSQML